MSDREIEGEKEKEREMERERERRERQSGAIECHASKERVRGGERRRRCID